MSTASALNESIDLDYTAFVGEDGIDDEDAIGAATLADALAFASIFGVDAELVTARGPKSGHPIVRFTGEPMRIGALVWVHCNGDAGQWEDTVSAPRSA